ncbi:acyl-CoA dehydrogenase family protein [Acuticoccus sp.]|uniref:acyl-CoA dehydrogenase family protein n=1 Tax=Acuticoccus sp. TaxID=1904378 RepID=UPI003B52482D
MRASDDDADYLARIDDFAREVVAPRAARWEADRRHCVDGLREAGRRGLIGIEISKELGGLGLTFRTKCAAAQRLAREDFGFALALINTHNATRRIASGGSRSLLERVLPGLLDGTRIGSTAITEPGGGCDVSGMTTCAQRTADGWHVTGAKAWLVNAVSADTFVVYAKTDPSEGIAGLTGLVVEAERGGVERGGTGDSAVAHAIGAGSIRLDHHAAQDAVIAEPPGVLRTLMHELNGARAYVAAMCVGMVEAAIERAARHGEERRTFGVPLHDHQGWRWALAQAATDVAAARALTDEASAVVDAGGDARVLAAQAKLFAARMAERHIAALGQAMGARGLSPDEPFTRFQAAARIANIVDGTAEMLLERIAVSLRRPTTEQ